MFAELASAHRFANFWMEQERSILIWVIPDLGRCHKS